MGCVAAVGYAWLRRYEEAGLMSIRGLTAENAKATRTSRNVFGGDVYVFLVDAECSNEVQAKRRSAACIPFKGAGEARQPRYALTPCVQ